MTRFEIVPHPRLAAVGKPITVYMRDLETANPIPAFWDKCFADGSIRELEKTPSYAPDSIGFMTDFDAEKFTYAVGMLKEPGREVPEGFSSYDIPAGDAAVSWIRGADAADAAGAAYELTVKAAGERGLNAENPAWGMEVYNCPRFTQKDAEGLITMDFWLPVKR
jgi:predicted transcriptional regulator YdeE